MWPMFILIVVGGCFENNIYYTLQIYYICLNLGYGTMEILVPKKADIFELGKYWETVWHGIEAWISILAPFLTNLIILSQAALSFFAAISSSVIDLLYGNTSSSNILFYRLVVKIRNILVPGIVTAHNTHLIDYTYDFVVINLAASKEILCKCF